MFSSFELDLKNTFTSDFDTHLILYLQQSVKVSAADAVKV